MKKLAFWGLLCLVSVIVIGVNHYNISRDIEGWKNRAQVSSEPNDMVLYLENVQRGMESRGMVTGHAALIFPTPDNNMSLIYHTVQQLVEQAKILTTMDKRSPEYQTGLDNLRGSIRELNLFSKDYWSVHQGIFWWLACILSLVVIVYIIFCF